MPTDARILNDCLGPLTMHLRRAQAAYRGYLEDGKTFRRALVLWDANNALRQHLLDTGWLLPEPMQEEATRIIAHLDIWAALWTAHRASETPTLEDVFAFANDDRFPGQAESALKHYFEQLNNTPDR
ncbi:MAG: hypothetical protein ACIAXF_10855 [Phycisphaerales bacterium JB063]